MINSYLSSALCICCIEFSRHSKDENGTSSQQLTESRRTGSVKEKPGWFWAGPSSFWSCSASFYPSSMMYNNCRRKKLNSETLMTQLRDKSCSMHSAHPSEHNFYIPCKSLQPSEYPWSIWCCQYLHENFLPCHQHPVISLIAMAKTICTWQILKICRDDISWKLWCILYNISAVFLVWKNRCCWLLVMFYFLCFLI